MTAPLKRAYDASVPHKSQPSSDQVHNMASPSSTSLYQNRIYRKRRRQVSGSSDVDPNGVGEPELTADSSSSSASSSSWAESLPKGGPLATQLKSERLASSFESGIAKGKRKAIEEHLESFTTVPARSVQAAFRTERCKFAKTGCTFTGSSAQVEAHERTYCTPLYTQLAHYKTLARQQSSSTASVQQDALNRQQEIIDQQSTRIEHLQSDLNRAQSQLEEERRLRTERLRKANEKLLELMSLSGLGEGKAEVYKLQLHAERELREKLEEEVESLRARLALAEDRL